jgi:hypothetical protein
VGEAEVDMAAFIGNPGKIRVHLPKCEFPETYIECEFKATETDVTKNEGEDSDDD